MAEKENNWNPWKTMYLVLSQLVTAGPFRGVQRLLGATVLRHQLEPLSQYQVFRIDDDVIETVYDVSDCLNDIRQFCWYLQSQLLVRPFKLPTSTATRQFFALSDLTVGLPFKFVTIPEDLTELPITEIHGKRVVNFSIPAPIVFSDGELPACSVARAELLRPPVGEDAIMPVRIREELLRLNVSRDVDCVIVDKETWGLVERDKQRQHDYTEEQPAWPKTCVLPRLDLDAPIRIADYEFWSMIG